MEWIVLIVDVLLFVVLVAYAMWGQIDSDTPLNLNLYRLKLMEGLVYRGIEVVDIDFGFIIGLLILWMVISLIFDVLRITDGLYTGMYTQSLAAQNNYIRWIEYTLGLSLMLFIISVIAGVKEFNTIFLILVANVVVMFQLNSIEIFELLTRKVPPTEQPDEIGRLTNRNEEPDANRYGWFIASLSQYILTSVIFYIILRDVFLQNADLKQLGVTMPDWIWVVVIGGLLLYSGVTIIQAIRLYYPATYIVYNRTYDILYLVLKVLVVVVILLGLSF